MLTLLNTTFQKKVDSIVFSSSPLLVKVERLCESGGKIDALNGVLLDMKTVNTVIKNILMIGQKDFLKKSMSCLIRVGH